ncbi:hypothetical protein DYB32_001136 [Aphanomyces invadans]|uniref:TFIIS N-terminal domain-containing protein n=1 Tax=Aphanomyces invadans TaxID=157072 RepID=A0A3R6WSQ4_9STRA|nr:hypothetical protein DYB32_001136 [Aphanomyces invadans]
MEERIRVSIETFMKKAKPDEAKSLKLVRQHVERALSLSLTNHKDVLKRLMHIILQRGPAPANAQPEVPVRPEITVAKTKSTWWKQVERREAMLMGCHRLFQFAVDHPECSVDVIQSLSDLSTVVNDRELYQLLNVYARQLGSVFVGHDMLPEWTQHSQPSPVQVLDCIASVYTLERIGVQHSRSGELRAFLDTTSLYSAEDYFGWNPALACPSTDPDQTAFLKMSNALTLLSYAHALDVSLGCTYASVQPALLQYRCLCFAMQVLRWLSSFYPYQGPSAMDEVEYMDQCYLALKCFGSSVDRGVAFALCYQHSFVQLEAESVDEVVHKATVALFALNEPRFHGYAPAIPDAQVLAILQRNASTEQQRRAENTATFESDYKRSQMKQSLRKLLDKAATMDVKLRIQQKLESTTDVKTLDAKLAISMLQYLNKMTLTMEALKETGLGKSVNKLRKHPAEEVAAASQALVAKWKKEMLATTVLATIPQRMVRVSTLLASEFPVTTPSQLTEMFTPLVSANASSNPHLGRLVTLVLDEIHIAIHELQRLERWIQLLTPRVADGNNFGVEVQKSVQLQISASRTALQKSWDAMTDYYWQRATAYEKFAVKVSKEHKKSSSQSKEEGGNDGAVDKKSQAESEDEITSAPSVIPDLLVYVVAVDVKWYFNLQRTLESIGDHYAFTLDAVEKNSAKIKLPRGHSERGMNMF